MNTQMNLQRISIEKLKPAKYNPRKDLKPGDPAYEKIKRSLHDFGYVDPVIWNEVTGNIVGGHQRYKVLVAEGATEIDCVVVHIENPQDEKALNIALNKAVGEWEPKALADLLQDLQLSGYDVGATGFDAAEVDDLFSKVHDKNVKDDDCDIDPEAMQPFVQPGDVWTLGRHRMVCGDSTNADDVALLMDGLKANLVVTDPPYNVAYESADGKSMEGCILRAPVPAAMTPRVQQKAQAQNGGTDIYRITGSRVNLRSGPGTGHRVLNTYRKGTEVLLQEKTNASWYEIVCPDGKRGFMSAKYLSFVRSESTVQTAVAEIVESRQLRDQPFRIYRVVPELHQVTVYARHIFYDLLDNMVKSLKPSLSAMGASVVQELVAACESEHPFTFFSDLITTAEEAEYTNINPVEALLGEDGIVAKYSGELQRDWYDVYVVERVGSDTDIEIREGKNLLGVSYDVDLTNLTTRIMPTGEDKDGELLYLPELYVDSLHVNDYPHPRWMHLAVSEAKEVTKGDDKKSKEQCYAELRTAAKAEFDRGCDLPTVTLDVDFINCADTEEYRDYHLLQNIYLGDAVRVIAPRIGVAVSMRLTQYTYDCLKRKYTQLSLGSVAEALEGNMISTRQLPSGSITGGKLASNSVGSLQLKAASIQAGHIDADAITTDKLAAGVVTAEKLAAGAVDAGVLSAITAKIGSLTAGDIETDTLAAGLAAITVLTCGSATFDQATVTHLVSEAMNLEFGVAGQVFIRNLAVEYAQMIGATIGNLCIKASDGKHCIVHPALLKRPNRVAGDSVYVSIESLKYAKPFALKKITDAFNG